MSSGLSLLSHTERCVWLEHVRGKDCVHWGKREESIVMVRTGLCNQFACHMSVQDLAPALTSCVTLGTSLKLSELLHLWEIG